MTLYEKTLYLIDNRNNKITIEDIANHINMTPAWVHKLKRGDIKNPSIHAVERIYTYLNGKGLDL